MDKNGASITLSSVCDFDDGVKVGAWFTDEISDTEGALVTSEIAKDVTDVTPVALGTALSTYAEKDFDPRTMPRLFA